MALASVASKRLRRLILLRLSDWTQIDQPCDRCIVLHGLRTRIYRVNRHFVTKNVLEMIWPDVCIIPKWLISIHFYLGVSVMEALILTSPVLVAAAGYSLVYLLAGGGFLGAIVIFVVAKMLGQ